MHRRERGLGRSALSTAVKLAVARVGKCPKDDASVFIDAGVLSAVVGYIRKCARSVIQIELVTVRWFGNDRAGVGVSYRQDKLPPYLFSAFSLAIFS